MSTKRQPVPYSEASSGAAARQDALPSKPVPLISGSPVAFVVWVCSA